MYPYPYQYQPVPVPPPQPSTPKGVGWVVRALILYLVALVLLALAAVVFVVILANLQPGQDIFQMLALILPALALVIPALIISLVCLIFYLVGFGYMYRGRNEFGPAHARNVRIALYLLILALVLGLASTVVTTALSFFAIRTDPFSQTITFDSGMYYAMQATSIGFGIVIAACVAAHFVLTIRALAKPQHERLLYAAAAIGTATPGVTGAVLLLVLPGYIDRLVNSPGGPFLGLGPDSGYPGLASAAMNLVTMLLFLLAFRGAEARLRTGELKPILPPPQMASWMPAPVVPYPPYGPYAPPAPMAPPQQPPPSPPSA